MSSASTVRTVRTEEDGRSLVAAAAAGDAALVRRLLDEGAAVDARGPGRQTALLAAVEADDVEIARLLLDRGADINAQADNFDTPWMQAGALGRADILELMLGREPDFSIRNRFGGNALIPACERGHVEAVRVLLRSAIDVNHVNNLGWTCLLEIVILGDGGVDHQQVARLVLAAGADPNIADRDGLTPAAHARERGQTDIERILISAGGR